MSQGLVAENLCVEVMGGVVSIGLEKAVGHAFSLTSSPSIDSPLGNLLIERGRCLVNTQCRRPVPNASSLSLMMVVKQVGLLLVSSHLL